MAVPTALALILLGACATGGTPSRPAPSPPPPAGAAEPRPTLDGAWRVAAVEEVGGGERLVAPTGGQQATIRFEPNGQGATRGRASGYAGVNSFACEYVFGLGERTVGALSISAVAATQRAGAEDAMRFESIFLEALGRARTITFSGNDAVIDTGTRRIELRR